MIVTRTQPAINIFYSWHYKLNSPSLAGFWENIAQFRFCQFFSQIQTKSSCFVKPFNISEAWIRQETQEFSALIPENFTRAQKYFTRARLVTFVTNSTSVVDVVCIRCQCGWKLFSPGATSVGAGGDVAWAAAWVGGTPSPPFTRSNFPTGAFWRINCSKRSGEGMKPMSQFSFTLRPTHQFPSNFSKMWRKSPILKLTALPCTGDSSSRVPSYITLVRTAKATCL